jgi:DNA-binding response OmpR family regulator
MLLHSSGIFDMGKRKVNVLIVDDERLDATVMRRALESVGGFVVFEAYDYDHAVRVFEAQKRYLKLLVADISLPWKNGIELAKELLREKPSLKVLFTSGWVGAEVMRASGIPALKRFFLPKPFKVSDFVSTVRKTLTSSESLDWRQTEEKTSAASGLD